MKTSPSQCIQYDRCHRYWRLRNVEGLYAPANHHEAFGTALHELVAGLLVDAEPDPAWSEGLTPEEAAKAQRMVGRAVDEKILVPSPALRVEEAFTLPLGITTVAGKIDCLDVEAGLVVDHKTASNHNSGTLKTPEQLREDIPMMLYAGYLLSKNSDLGRVRLRHNQFVLADESVTFSEVEVATGNVRMFWRERIMPIIQGQREAAATDDWLLVPGHPPDSEACTKWGGCEFAMLCHNGVPIEKWKPPAPEDPDGVPF